MLTNKLSFVSSCAIILGLVRAFGLNPPGIVHFEINQPDLTSMNSRVGQLLLRLSFEPTLLLGHNLLQLYCHSLITRSIFHLPD